MKLIIAIIRPYHLDSLQLALEPHNVFITSITEVLGGNRAPGHTVVYRDRVVNVRAPKYRVELMVDAGKADKVVEAIHAATVAGCPGQVSDAKIMVVPLEETAPTPKRERQHAQACGVN
jgi:nitrogen regulatory protein PII